ncbi:MAG: hypothetical protein ACI4PQ_04895 [Butyricicoccaceae bacterium]
MEYIIGGCANVVMKWMSEEKKRSIREMAGVNRKLENIIGCTIQNCSRPTGRFSQCVMCQKISDFFGGNAALTNKEKAVLYTYTLIKDFIKVKPDE